MISARHHGLPGGGRCGAGPVADTRMYFRADVRRSSAVGRHDLGKAPRPERPSPPRRLDLPSYDLPRPCRSSTGQVTISADSPHPAPVTSKPPTNVIEGAGHGDHDLGQPPGTERPSPPPRPMTRTSGGTSGRAGSPRCRRSGAGRGDHDLDGRHPDFVSMILDKVAFRRSRRSRTSGSPGHPPSRLIFSPQKS